jgi:hypothetical protein
MLMTNASASSKNAADVRGVPEEGCIEYRAAGEDKAPDYRQCTDSLLIAVQEPCKLQESCARKSGREK